MKLHKLIVECKKLLRKSHNAYKDKNHNNSRFLLMELKRLLNAESSSGAISECESAKPKES